MKTALQHLILTVLVAALCPAGLSAEALTIQADYSVFYDLNDKSPYIEFYYGIYQKQLGFIGADTLDYQFAGVFASVDLFNLQEQRIDSCSTYFLSKITDSADNRQSNIRLFDFLSLRATPGRYRAEVTVIDDVSKAAGKAELKVLVPEYVPGELVVSGLELAYEIRDVDKASETTINPRLIKAGRLVIPNPAAAYQLGTDSVIHVYSELYGLGSSGEAIDGFVVNYKIKDSLGAVIHDFGDVKYDKPGATAVISNALPIAGIEGGHYFLSMEIVDLHTQQSTLALKPFTLAGEVREPEDISLADIELMVNVAWYHLSEAEKIQIQKLNPKAQANMVLQFWRRMDDDPSTPENPFYSNVVRRFRYANDHFSSYSTRNDGWKSDRGRVYITYGPYDHELDLPMPGTNDPMIKWEYFELEGGVIFIFVSDDMAGGVDYRLVHSTYPREKYDPYWERLMTEEAPEETWKHGDD